MISKKNALAFAQMVNQARLTAQANLSDTPENHAGRLALNEAGYLAIESLWNNALSCKVKEQFGYDKEVFYKEVWKP
jgi:hypothetical protein